jgi:hypothetical protein
LFWRALQKFEHPLALRNRIVPDVDDPQLDPELLRGFHGRGYLCSLIIVVLNRQQNKTELIHRE